MSELWENPLLDMQTRYEIAVGTINNLREQLNRRAPSAEQQQQEPVAENANFAQQVRKGMYWPDNAKPAPIAKKLASDPEDERDGLWFSAEDMKKLEALPAGTPLYTHQQPQGDTVPMPQNADQAQMMANLGISWLETNAPERLKQPQAQGEPMGVDEFNSIHGPTFMGEPVLTPKEKPAREFVEDDAGCFLYGDMAIRYLRNKLEKTRAAVPDVRTMVDRFLMWKLPKNFAPDCGISFENKVNLMVDGKLEKQERPDSWWPTGTNLFDANQARTMVEHMLAAAPAQPGAVPEGWREVLNRAYESVGAGAHAEAAAYERQIVHPHIDGIIDELEALEAALVQPGEGE